MDLSKWPHVSENELACRLCGVVHGEPRPELLDLFEAIRKRYGGPIKILSASRCEKHQKQLIEDGLKAAKAHFPHVPLLYPDGVSYFHALDLKPVPFEWIKHLTREDQKRLEPATGTGYDLAEYAKTIMPDAGIGVDAYDGRFCHIDVCHLAQQPYWRPGRRW
jgi:hypothetical protein